MDLLVSSYSTVFTALSFVVPCRARVPAAYWERKEEEVVRGGREGFGGGVGLQQ